VALIRRNKECFSTRP